MTVSFDSDQHIYYVNGEQVPSVTQALKKAGWIDGSFYAPAAAHRGTVAHEAIVLADQGIVGADFYASEIAGYVMAYLKFRRETDWQTVGYEEIVFSESWAGTQDLRGTLNGKPTIIDIKTGKPAEWHGVQLAAYRCAPYRSNADGEIVEQDSDPPQVRNLYVATNGQYRLGDRQSGLKYDSPVWDQRWKSVLKVL